MYVRILSPPPPLSLSHQKCVINGHIIPEGHAVAYMSYAANRDGKVFNDPNQFQPERWRNE